MIHAGALADMAEPAGENSTSLEGSSADLPIESDQHCNERGHQHTHDHSADGLRGSYNGLSVETCPPSKGCELDGGDLIATYFGAAKPGPTNAMSPLGFGKADEHADRTVPVCCRPLRTG